jgi:hypothetical protein
MSSEPANIPALITPQHYQILCGLGLGLILLVSVEEGQTIAGLLAVLIGGLGVLLRLRLSPVLVLLALAAGRLYVQYLTRLAVIDFPPRGGVLFQPLDLVLCMATLGYVAGHYRLQSIWFNILPADPRRRYRRETRLVIPADRVGKVVPPQRSASLLTPAELAWFVLQLPLAALAAQGVWWLLSVRWSLTGLPPRLTQVLVLLWLVVIGLLVVGQLFRTWRRRQMDVATARTLLQDVLWNETRGEQRRIARWLAWWRLRDRPAAK